MVDRFLYRDAAERERLIALTLRLRLAFGLAVALMLVPILVGIPTFGVAPAVPLLLGGLVYAVLDLGLPTARHPERRVVASAATGVLATLVAISLADGPKEYLFVAPVVPMLGLAAVATRRVSVTAAVATSLGLVAVAFATYGDQVRTTPPILILPIVLLLVTVFGSMASRSSEEIDRETAVVDPLTGLLNRVALQARAIELQLQASASPDRVGMIVVDLDRMSRINADHGRAIGDAVLVEVAGRLRAEVGNAGTVFRFGGEEFVVLLQSATPGTAVGWAKRLREAICFAPVEGVDVTASFGVAVSGSGAGFAYRSLFVEADAALYRAKTLGRDRVCSAELPGDEPLPQALAEDRQSVRRATDVEPASELPEPALSGQGSWDARLRGTAEGNWLIADGVERAHAVDLLQRSREASAINSAITLTGLVLCGFWVGWWMLVPPVLAGLVWRLCTTRIADVRRPEFIALGGLLLIVGSGALATTLASPDALYALPLVAMVVFGACAGFNRAGALVIACTALVATTVAAFCIDASTVIASPVALVFPLMLILANALLGQSLGRVAREHRESAVTDGLTGLLNQAALEARIPQLVQHTSTSGAPTTLMVVDVDHVGEVNARHGRAMGDEVLSEVSARLRGTLRAFDSVYRARGATFVVVLADTAADDARSIAERARRAVSGEPVNGIAVTVSVGVATAPAGELLDYDAVYAAASARLDAAKRGGYDRTIDDDDERSSALRLLVA